MQLYCNYDVSPAVVVARYDDGTTVPAGAHPGLIPVGYEGDLGALGKVGDPPPAGMPDIRPYAAPPFALADYQSTLCADLDAQAEAQRLKYATGGATKAMVYLQKQTQAAGALQGLAATPPMTAEQGVAAYVLLAAEVGITVDPSTGKPAADVFGVARAIAATVAIWLPLAAKIEGVCAAAKAAVSAATTAQAAQAAHDAVIWPAGS